MTPDDKDPVPSSPAGRFEWELRFREALITPASTKLLGFILATYADTRTGASIRPGVTRLAKDTGASVRNVSRGLQALEAAGYIMCVRHGSSYGRGGKGMASLYRLTLPVVREAVEKQVTPVSADPEQVTPVSPLVDNHRQGLDRGSEQETTGAGSADIQGTSEDIYDATGDTGVRLSPHELPPHESFPQQATSGWTVTSPGPVDNSATGLLAEEKDDIEARYRTAHNHLMQLAPERYMGLMDQAREQLGDDAPLRELVIHAATLRETP